VYGILGQGECTMSGIVIVSNDYITLEYRPAEQLIYHTVHQPIGHEQAQMLMDTLNAGTDALRQYGVSKWLSDDRKNGPLPPEVIEWGNRDWDPRTIAAGWKYWANVVPHELAAAGTLMPVIESLYTLGLRMQVFTTVEDALQWLAKM
jgi:hypothetical protein